MKRAFADLQYAHRVMGQEAPAAPTVLRPETGGETEEICVLAVQLRAASARLREQGTSVAALRVQLIAEELAETLESMVHGDLEKFADGLGDTVYALIGTAESAGIPFPAVWDEIVKSNRSKMSPCEPCFGTGFTPEDRGCSHCRGTGRTIALTPQGKMIKPPTFVPPNIGAALGLAPAARKVSGHGRVTSHNRGRKTVWLGVEAREGMVGYITSSSPEPADAVLLNVTRANVSPELFEVASRLELDDLIYFSGSESGDVQREEEPAITVEVLRLIAAARGSS